MASVLVPNRLGPDRPGSLGSSLLFGAVLQALRTARALSFAQLSRRLLTDPLVRTGLGKFSDGWKGRLIAYCAAQGAHGVQADIWIPGKGR
ncbi:MAG TPA: hypothetical protein VNG12_14530 [Acidimicrobiales bacterium]|nr:hypothetical protein [Acidimicrobiales bacterium]